ncbi:MAG: hypothetical protein U0176_01815 [Bacteroidia bacterium]
MNTNGMTPPREHDKLRLHIHYEPLPQDTSGKRQLAISATINDIPVVEWWDLPIDIRAMKESAILSGKYFLWTCTCGIPYCAGLRAAIQVKHHESTITWKGGVPPLQDFGDMTFDKEAYQETVQSAWQRLQEEARWHHRDKEVFEVMLMELEEVLWKEGGSNERPKPNHNKCSNPPKKKR